MRVLSPSSPFHFFSAPCRRPHLQLIDLCALGPSIPTLKLPKHTASPPLLAPLPAAAEGAAGPSSSSAAADELPAPGTEGYPLGVLMVTGLRAKTARAAVRAPLSQRPAPAGPVVAPLPQFRRQFEAATRGALKYVDWSNVVAAGGLVEACARPAPQGLDTE